MMSNDWVEVDKADHLRHRTRGHVIECLSGNRYTVEFVIHTGAIGRRYELEVFDGKHLRALIMH